MLFARIAGRVNIMNNGPLQILELVSDFELDDIADLTIVMSRDELDLILSIDAACAGRAGIHDRPTVVMGAVKVA